MKFTILFAATVAAFFILVRPSPAAAEFAICNSSTWGEAKVAIAITWTDSNGAANGESEGWWPVPQGECKIVITTVDVSGYTVYLYGFSEDKNPDHYWGGNYNYCLDPVKKFSYLGNSISTPFASGKQRRIRILLARLTVTPHPHRRLRNYGEGAFTRGKAIAIGCGAPQT